MFMIIWQLAKSRTSTAFPDSLWEWKLKLAKAFEPLNCEVDSAANNKFTSNVLGRCTAKITDFV